MPFKILPLLFFALVCCNAFSQRSTSFHDNANIYVGYYGYGIANPGMKFGADFPLWKVNRGYSLQNQSIRLGLDLGGLKEPNRNNALFGSLGLKYQWVGRIGFIKALTFNYGMLRTILPQTYVADGDKILDVKSEGSYYQMASTGFVLGKSIRQFAFVIHPEFVSIFPFNLKHRNNLSLTVSLMYNFQ